MQARAKIAQGLLGKMVQDEAANAGIGVCFWQGLKEISPDPLDAARQGGGTLDQVEAGHGGGGKRGLDFAAEGALAGADFDDSGGGRRLFFELSHDPAGVAQEEVDQPEVVLLAGSTNVGPDGTVTETVIDYRPGSGQRLEVEDDAIQAQQSVQFSATGSSLTIALELDYTLRGNSPFRMISDWLFIRRAEAESLRRTLAAFAAELEQREI